MRLSTPERLAELVRDATRVDVPLLPPFGSGLRFDALTGEIEHAVADGVVTCLAGTSLTELNAVLAHDGRCLPYAKIWPPEVDDLASLILLNLPHAEEARFGSWRDWIVGATMATAEGTLVHSGSRVVKSVAGYDAHRLMVGSRGTLVLPARVSLRTFPISPQGYPHTFTHPVDNPAAILRLEQADMREGLNALGDGLFYADEATGTLWTTRFVHDLDRIPCAWSMNIQCPAIPTAVLRLHLRAKAILDPGGKLAPGAFHNLP
jgi:hypothetical protein